MDLRSQNVSAIGGAWCSSTSEIRSRRKVDPKQVAKEEPKSSWFINDLVVTKRQGG